REIKQLEHDLSEKKNELLAFSEKVPIELEAKARRQLKNVEVPTGEKNWLGKPKMKTEKRPTENVVVSETDYKKLVSAAQENKKLKYENKVAYDDLSKFMAKNRALEKENRELSWQISDLKDHISDLKQDVRLIYQSAKEFLRERTDSLKAFKNVFKGFVDKVKDKTTQFEQKHDLGAKVNEFEKVHKQELRKEQNRGME